MLKPLKVGAFFRAAAETRRIYAVRYVPQDEKEVVLPPEYTEYADVFSKENADEVPPKGGPEHAIELTGEPPFGPLYNLSVKELAALRDFLREVTSKGWIRESESRAGAPILFTPKKDGELRLCVDYHGLN